MAAHSRYAPLETHLRESGRAEIPMTFEDIEEVLGATLPPSARKHRAWWSNNPTNSPMTLAWRAGGYESASVDMATGTLVFRKVGPGEGLCEIELWVGGDMYQKDHDDAGPLHVAFTGRLLTESDGLALDAIPAIRVYQTRTGKLIVYHDWRGGAVEDAGATYLEFPDLKALVASPSALNTLWIDGSGDPTDRPDLERQLLHHVAAALREKLVIRID